MGRSFESIRMEVRRVTSFEVGEPLELEVDPVKYCDAR